MVGKVLEVDGLLNPDILASKVVDLYKKYSDLRQPFLDELAEVKRYCYQTAANEQTQEYWRNNTSLPLLSNLMDLLHANYHSGLFPNDDWLKWEAFSKESSLQNKKQAIEGYMKNKTRDSQYASTVSELLYDYILGYCFCTIEWVNETKIDELSGTEIQGYIGPRLVRIPIENIVFNPLAPDFNSTFKIIKSYKNIGEIAKEYEETGVPHLKEILDRRQELVSKISGYETDQFNNATQYAIDGFGSLKEYYQQGVVEILEFWGDMYDEQEGVLKQNQVITVIDRRVVIRQQTWSSWFSNPPIYYSTWRKRPGNLYGTGPLTPLVGIQYRIDHLENAKADAIDKELDPVTIIQGVVDELPDNKDAPGSVLRIQEGGSITHLPSNLSPVIQANNEIMQYIKLGHDFAGAPEEAAGIRTPGEKTLGEVMQLLNAAGRIFQEKISQFEVDILEPSLNGMLESSRRNADIFDVIRVFKEDTGIPKFLEITREDIVSNGRLRPIGARHFSAQDRVIQQLVTVSQTNLWGMMQNHIGSKELTSMIIGSIVPNRYELYKPNIIVADNMELQREKMIAEQQIAEEDSIDTRGLMS